MVCGAVGLLLVTPESCNTFLDYPCKEHWYPVLVCVCCVRRRLPLLQICGTAGLPLESVVSSRVRSITRVGDVSGGSKACATELVRHTSQIWFRSWIQKYPKRKREGAVGVDGERDEFNSFAVRGNNERED